MKGIIKYKQSHTPLQPKPLNSRGSRNNATKSRDGSDIHITIVGSGLAGLTTALALASTPSTANLNIAIVDSRPYATKNEFLSYPELKSSIISPASAKLFQALDIWDSLKSIRHRKIQFTKIWDSIGSGSLSFGNPQSELGYVFENRMLQYFLMDTLRRKPNIYLEVPAAVESVRITKNSQKNNPDLEHPLRITLEDGREYSSQMILGTDWSSDVVRRIAGFPDLTTMNHALCFVVSVEHETDHDATLYHRHIPPSGQIALLPHYERFGSIVWQINPKFGDQLLRIPDQQLISLIHDAFEGMQEPKGWRYDEQTGEYAPTLPSPSPFKIPKIKRIVGSRGVYPTLVPVQKPAFVKPRMAVLGEQSQFLHPLAGQGINQALGEAASMATTIIEAVENKESIGSLKVLQKYQTNTQIRNSASASGQESLQRLLQSNYFPHFLGSNMGMKADTFHPSMFHLKVQSTMDPISDFAIGIGINLEKIGPNAKKN